MILLYEKWYHFVLPKARGEPKKRKNGWVRHQGAGSNLQALTFKDEAGAKEGEKAAKSTLEQLVPLVIEWRNRLARDAADPRLEDNEAAQAQIKELTTFLKELENVLKKAEVATTGKEVHVTLPSPTTVGKLVRLLFAPILPAMLTRAHTSTTSTNIGESVKVVGARFQRAHAPFPAR